MERSEADMRGMTRYKTGRPCKHEHIAERMTSSGTCCECLRLRKRQRSSVAIARRKSNMARKRLSPERVLQYKARTAVGNALRSDKLVKPDVCEWCDSTIKIEAHHEDYSKLLEVIWLCQQCHLKHHGKH